MPIVGMSSAAVSFSATGEMTISSTIMHAPASWRARASASMSSYAPSPRPWNAAPAQHVLALRSEAKVAHERDASVDDCLDLSGHAPATLELDGVRLRELHHADRGLDGLLGETS